MGAMQNNPPERGTRSSKRGSTDNESRLQAFASGGGNGEGDWGGCSADKLLAVVVGITSLGGAVTLGMSRDQGAYSVTLLLDKTRKTLWYNGDADLDAELDAVARTLATME